MATQSSLHYYLNWAKERVDEMDAALASLESKVSEVHANARVTADQLLADIRKKRDDFRSAVKRLAAASEPAWIKAKTQLESDWSGFEVDVKRYVESFGKQVEQQQATFKVQADAQMKAWHEAADSLRSAAKCEVCRRQSGRNLPTNARDLGWVNVYPPRLLANEHTHPIGGDGVGRIFARFLPAPRPLTPSGLRLETTFPIKVGHANNL